MKIFMVAGWNEKLWRDAGLKKSMLDPQFRTFSYTHITYLRWGWGPSMECIINNRKKKIHLKKDNFFLLPLFKKNA